MSASHFRVVQTLTGRRLSHLSLRAGNCAHDVAISVEQLCDGLSMLCGPWLWEGFPVAALRQPNELDPRVWEVSP